MAIVDMELCWLMVVRMTLKLFLDQAMDMDLLRHQAMSEYVLSHRPQLAALQAKDMTSQVNTAACD